MGKRNSSKGDPCHIDKKKIYLSKKKIINKYVRTMIEAETVVLIGLSITVADRTLTA